MPRQVYRCPKHGEFEMSVHFKGDVPKTAACPVPIIKAVFGRFYEYDCPKVGVWVPSAPNFIGGPTTGAKKGD